VSTRFPLAPFPRGWFQIGYGDALGYDLPLGMHFFGHDLVCFRRPDGHPVLADAVCPHLGASLADGAVEDGLLICPFHGWAYDSEGRNCRIPYAEKPNRGARLATWSVEERFGLLFAWYPRHEPPGWPLSDLQLPAEFAERLERADVIRNEYRVATHVQEVLENTVDTAHFIQLHRCLETPQVETWAEDHRFASLTKQVLRGAHDSRLESRVDSRLCGPGLNVNLIEWADSRIYSFLNATPVDVDDIVVWLQGCASAPGTIDEERLYDRAVLQEFQKDVNIFAVKRYIEAPLLAAGEKPIIDYRRWASQFYLNLPEPVGVS
jgi:phenylpropionate dioxygenase-like ring-hydroxylating dioxygenase large terminal subunit